MTRRLALVVVVGFLSVGPGTAGGRAVEPGMAVPGATGGDAVPITGDRSFDRSLAQYRRLAPGWGAWHPFPYEPSAALEERTPAKVEARRPPQRPATRR